MGKRALITGITGQDGSYLAELLLSKGYEVHGLVRRVALEDPRQHLTRLEPVQDQISLHAGSLESPAALYKLVYEVQPDECYHLAAQSFVSYSFEDECSTLNSNINGTHSLLMAMRECAPKGRFYFAASSEMFGKVTEIPQTERTRFHPRSAYGISKAAGYHLTVHYREAYGLHGCCGILFNHESPRRGMEFVTRKISYEVARIKLGLLKELRLGNLAARRDWGFAGDYVKAMWLMLQQERPDDYVIATGVAHSVQDVVNTAFAVVDLDPKEFVVVDPALFRLAEVDFLLGDASKAKRELRWTSKVSFRALIEMMVKADLERLTAKASSPEGTASRQTEAVAAQVSALQGSNA